MHGDWTDEVSRIGFSVAFTAVSVIAACVLLGTGIGGFVWWLFG